MCLGICMLQKIDTNQYFHLKTPSVLQKCFKINLLYITQILYYDIFWNIWKEINVLTLVD